MALLCVCGQASEPAQWRLARSEHFEVYSNAPGDAARSLLTDFERLHAFFMRQIGVGPRAHRPVRVICFGSAQEYNSYRARPAADAYFLGTESRDYIVMASGSGASRVAAHEYAHLLIHSSGRKLPEWITEGISDVASTVQIGERDSRIGGDLPGRSQVLRNRRMMPLRELFEFTPRNNDDEALFYAQSWALADLLMTSPAYAPRWVVLLGAMASGLGSERALTEVYRMPLDAIERDLHIRVAQEPVRKPVPIPLPGIAAGSVAVQVETLAVFAARQMLADLHFASGDLAQSEADYRRLAAEQPDAAEIPAAMGLIALKRGDAALALAQWKRAVDLGIADAALCHRYAVLADSRGAAPALVRLALERALALQPDFDEVHYHLALLEKNAGSAGAAVFHLRAMREVPPARAFAYWSSLADALLDLDRRAEAKAAAFQAHEHAGTEEERSRAVQLAYQADTVLGVELTTGADGQPQFRAVRVPHDAPPRNPFIENGDKIQRADATLQNIECSDGGIRVMVSTARGALTLAVPDPARVQIRNGGGVEFEFTCGPQTGRKVMVEYAPERLVLRGIELR
jgi:tetratricopeptide (TPR) repeat protein